MGNIKISELPAAGTIDGTEYVEVVQGGVNKKVQISEFPAGTTPTLQEVADTGADTTTPLTYNGVELSTIEIQVTADLTAENDKHYVLVSSAVFTDPTPVTGKGYTILLSNLQTATVGGVAYGGTNGNIVKRYYIAGSWITRSFYSNEKNVTLYSPIASPTFTGTPLAPTAPAGTNNTQIATTAYADAKGAHQGFYTGKWKTIPFASVPTGLNGWVGGIIYIPIPIGETQTFTRIGEEVTTGIAAQNIRLALYRSVNGLPANLIEDSGNLSAVTNGLKDFTFTSPVTVNASEKQVFAAIQVSNNSIGLRVANSVCLNYFNGSGLTGSLFFQVQAFGAFPANATPVAYNNVISPLVSLLMQ